MTKDEFLELYDNHKQDYGFSYTYHSERLFLDDFNVPYIEIKDVNNQEEITCIKLDNELYDMWISQDGLVLLPVDIDQVIRRNEILMSSAKEELLQIRSFVE